MPPTRGQALSPRARRPRATKPARAPVWVVVEARGGFSRPAVGTELSVEPAQVHGSPGLFLRIDGKLDMVVAVRVEGGLVTGLYTVRNPEKLAHVQHETAVSR